MKRLHWYILFDLVVLSLFMYSCTSSESSTDNVKTVDVLNVDSPLKITMADIVDSVSYIPLNTEECLLSSIEKVQYDRGLFFVKDAKGLYVFNESGMFVNEIGKRGPGPKEYRYINACFLDKENKNVCIISHPDGRLLTYDYTGVFLSSSRLEKEDMNVSYVVSLPEKQLLVHRPLSNYINENDSEYVTMALEEDSYVSSPLLPNVGISSKDVEYSFLRYPVSFYNGKYYAISTFSNVVYSYIQQSLEPEFILDMPDIAPTKTFIKSHDDMDFFSFSKLLDEEKMGKGIMAIAASDENLFMLVKNGQTVIYNGKESAVVAPFIYHSDVDMYFHTLFECGLFDDILGYYGAETLLSKREYIYEGDNTALKQIVGKLHEEDNPVIFRCHLKHNIIGILKKMINNKEDEK